MLRQYHYSSAVHQDIIDNHQCDIHHQQHCRGQPAHQQSSSDNWHHQSSERQANLINQYHHLYIHVYCHRTEINWHQHHHVYCCQLPESIS